MSEENTKELELELEQKASEGVEAKAGEEKTFTQEELDKIIKKRLSKERAKVENQFKNDEEYKAYLDYKESSKTQEQKQQDELEKYKQIEEENKQYKKQIETLNQLGLVRKANVNDDFTEFVTYKVQQLVTDELKFEDALETFLDENKQFTKKTLSGGMHQADKVDKVDGLAEAFYKLNPKLKN